MNKEEKEAIEYIKFKTIAGLETLQLEKDVKALEILLNYIDKLQKENEELKEQRDNAIKLRNELIEEQKITCISKNKIRNKIKEVAEEPQIYVDTEKFDIEFEKSNYTIDVLKELLGE